MNVNTLLVVGLAFVVTGVVLAFGAYIVSEVKTTLNTTDTTVNGVFDNAIDGLGKLGQWMPLIAIVAAAAIIISMMLIFRGASR